MFALSARFSSSGELDSSPVKNRGDRFAKSSFQLFNFTCNGAAAGWPSMKKLQGSILFTYYVFTSSPSFIGYIGVGTLCQMAYGLSLHEIDVDTQSVDLHSEDSVTEWVLKEEKRRAWWAVWELDTFASTIARQPFMIQMEGVRVLLPVTDHAWFNRTPVTSAAIATSNPLEAWRTLECTLNQSNYAWYLLAHSYVRWALEFYKARTSVKDLQRFISTVKCLLFSLPETFNLRPLTSSDVMDCTRKSLAISTHVLLQTSATLAAMLIAVIEPNRSLLSDPDSAPSYQANYQNCLQACSSYSCEIVNVVRQLSPDTIPFSSPWLAVAIVGPASIHIAKREYLSESNTSLIKELDMDRQILLQAIKHMARYWDLASMLVDFVNATESSEEKTPQHNLDSSITTQNVFVTRFRNLRPDIVQNYSHW
ncbi:hypothetical protein F5884DRAFT_735877 [Xylogone sp. PMI_703]|nr:hypothetical protein F5884DRAFT_735877 [Xylogone sp. PMI_703]